MKRVAALTIGLCIAIGCLAPAIAEKAGAKVFQVTQAYTEHDLPAFLPMIHWDMSLEELKYAKVGTAPIVSGDRVEYYSVPLLDQLASVTCVFSGQHYEHLDMVMVLLNEPDGTDPQRVFERLSAALDQQYGKPSRVSREWTGVDDEKSKDGAQVLSQENIQEYHYYENLDFQLSCTLENWDGALLASALFQRGGVSEKVDLNGLVSDPKAEKASPIREFAVNQPTPQPEENGSGESTAPQDILQIWDSIGWGMNHEEVRAQRGLRATEDSDQWLRYDAVLSDGHPVSLAYYFEKDALKRFYIIYRDAHKNKSDYVDDFHAVGASLTDASGKPTTSGWDWKRYAYKDMPEQVGLAVALGDLRISELWEKDGYSITHALVGDDLVINHYIEFSAPERSR